MQSQTSVMADHNAGCENSELHVDCGQCDVDGSAADDTEFDVVGVEYVVLVASAVRSVALRC